MNTKVYKALILLGVFVVIGIVVFENSNYNKEHRNNEKINKITLQYENKIGGIKKEIKKKGKMLAFSQEIANLSISFVIDDNSQLEYIDRISEELDIRPSIGYSGTIEEVSTVDLVGEAKARGCKLVPLLSEVGSDGGIIDSETQTIKDKGGDCSSVYVYSGSSYATTHVPKEDLINELGCIALGVRGVCLEKWDDIKKNPFNKFNFLVFSKKSSLIAKSIESKANIIYFFDLTGMSSGETNKASKKITFEDIYNEIMYLKSYVDNGELSIVDIDGFEQVLKDNQIKRDEILVKYREYEKEKEKEIKKLKDEMKKKISLVIN